MKRGDLGPDFPDRAALDEEVTAALEDLIGDLITRGVPLPAALAAIRRVARRADGWGRAQ